MEKRIRRLGIFMLVCFVALFIQLNNIQVLKANSLATDANNPREIAISLSQPRGDIVSADGVTLADSVPATSGPYKYQRVYNPKTAQLFAQIVGYNTIFGTRTGVEAEYNNYLMAHTRSATSLRDLLTNRTITDNVTLTVNSHLQLEVAGIMDQTATKDGAPSDAAVVVNVKTGAIEAMYSNPTYDPNLLTSSDGSTVSANYNSLDPGSAESSLVSRAFQFGFIPGSTFKTVTSSAVYDHQPALATVDYPQASCITIPQQVNQFCNYGTASGHESCGGTIQVTLPASCNTAFAQMGMSLKTSLATEADAYGFNQKIPLDLPAVGVSTFPTAAQLTGDDPLQASSAIGQGFGTSTVIATPLQMALVAAGIANQGKIMTPHVMQQIRDSEGNLVRTYTPSTWLTATTPQTAAAVTALMQAVVTKGTASTVGFPASWDVAAKTGTAETGTGNATGSNLTNDWMIAFAPANDPQVAVAVVVPNQPGSQTGASVSGPPMKAILQAILDPTP
jgi:penicillin-binding protein A